MKKLYLLFVLFLCSAATFSQPLFTYGGKPVDKEEFLRAYNKNKTPVTDKEKALREYLDLYIRFKLKVAAAKDMKLDTLPQLQYDAQSFGTQIQDGYLSNEKAMDDLVVEAFSRSQKDLHVLHFFAAVSNTAKPEDTGKVYKAISTLYNSLAAGNSDYEKQVALAGGENIKQSDIGFITAFSLPYEYENIIYSLNNGQVSKPYRSKNGWHVFKIIDERKAAGKWKIAQILIALPPEQQEINRPLLQKKADSVYNLLKGGADFGQMARLVSDDKLTYGNNGELPEFGSGRYQVSFENEIFRLGRDGEISKPFVTEYGYHIVKRLSHIPVSADKEDPAYQFDLKQKVQQDARANIARELFVKEIQKQINFKKTGVVADAELYRYADSIIANPAAGTGDQPISNKTIFSFGKSKITGKDWLDFVRSYKGSGELYQNENNAALVEKFISSSSLDYYKKNLEEYNSDYRYQMQEFRDGNVLFEIMERNVWGNAAADTAALAKHYNANKNKYLWAASADIILFNCFSKTIADGAQEALKAGKDWKKIVEEAGNRIQADSGRFELSQIPIVVDTKLPHGSLTETMVNAQDGSAGFAKIIRHYADGMQRSFDEARGLVINDYQNILEEKWINDLKKKYPVKINEPTLQSLLK
jgi:peptidyl-prolyl cis-trans isomerase SurA